MKDINLYIVEKLKVNKDTANSDKIFSGNNEELAQIMCRMTGFPHGWHNTIYEIFKDWLKEDRKCVSFYITKIDYDFINERINKKSISYQLKDLNQFIIDDKVFFQEILNIRNNGKWILNDRGSANILSYGDMLLIENNIIDYPLALIIKAIDIDYKKRYGELG